MAKINRNCNIESNLHNDIYRKFESQFELLLYHPFDDKKMYVDYVNEEFDRKMQLFKNNRTNEIKFLSGDAGVGKTTYLKHLFEFGSSTNLQFRKKKLIMTFGWDGLSISDEKYKEDIKQLIINTLSNAIQTIYNDRYNTIIERESKSLIKFILETRQDLLVPLTMGESKLYVGKEADIKQLEKTHKKSPIPFYATLLKYVISKNKGVNKIFIIIDDVETLSEIKIIEMANQFLHLYNCLCNIPQQMSLNIKLLISLRPYSILFLNNNRPLHTNSTYGMFVKSDDVIDKNKIPNVKKIFKKRFDYVDTLSSKPGNKETWNDAKIAFNTIIDSIEEPVIKLISEICHNDIRAVIKVFKLILSNRVWCQEYNAFPPQEHFKINPKDYRFDIVNIIRTISCGESSVYLGNRNTSFNIYNFEEMMKAPSFDGSSTFIPNILVDFNSGRLDLLTILIMEYIYSRKDSITVPMSEECFITKKALCEQIHTLFSHKTTVEKINQCLDIMFANRLIKKSIYCKDNDDSINTLQDKDSIYLSLKGNRLLLMFEYDSVLLEVYREDIDRDYKRIDIQKSAYDLIREGNRELLFQDLIDLTYEISVLEDEYCYTYKTVDSPFFQNELFPITIRIMSGIGKSLARSSLNEDVKERIQTLIEDLNKKLNDRIQEISTMQLKI